ncbi:plasmid mobilization protein [Seohaeicola zhoushanensis]|uniref:Uncharacterized protein n=1 Tax=Seohaeicola zhoushanensis TaxID=1569283 RepID=A0A8J3H2M1_9RHOB|nr:hypothetical protein [Seohaeicola zhoushanensis]GHF70045.1 hypothetical protein GCM10017056_46370 [Seohaeicola zhoushanensis]
MSKSGSEKRQRAISLKARFNDAEAALIRDQAARTGVSVAALIRFAVLHQHPPKSSRIPPLDREAAAQMIGKLGQVAGALRAAADQSDAVQCAAIIDAAHRDLADMRAALFEALGRLP